MKTAISIPDPIFKSVEQMAKRLGLSRSQLFTQAAMVFVEEHSAKDVTKALDRIYGEEPAVLETGFKSIQSKSIKKASSW